jgi:hypothetical protein
VETRQKHGETGALLLPGAGDVPVVISTDHTDLRG